MPRRDVLDPKEPTFNHANLWSLCYTFHIYHAKYRPDETIRLILHDHKGNTEKAVRGLGSFRAKLLRGNNEYEKERHLDNVEQCIKILKKYRSLPRKTLVSLP